MLILIENIRDDNKFRDSPNANDEKKCTYRALTYFRAFYFELNITSWQS